jgi:hypothetical protein
VAEEDQQRGAAQEIAETARAAEALDLDATEIGDEGVVDGRAPRN